MHFSILKTDNSNKLKALSKNRISFLKQEGDISLFHFNQLNNDLFHVVFNIRDEYQVGTKKLGSQYNYPYSSLINMFFLTGKQFVLVEYVNKEYQEDVIEEVKRKTKVSMVEVKLNNKLLQVVLENLDGKIKKINYSNDDGELFDLDYINNSEFAELIANHSVNSFTALVGKFFVTVTDEGKISVNNSDENYLVDFSKRVLNAIY